VKLEPTDGGVFIRVLAKPGARRNAVTGAHDGMLRISVTQAPEAGKANDAVIRVLAKALGLKRSQLSLVSGPRSQRKKLVVADVTVEDMRARIARCLDG